MTSEQKTIKEIRKFLFENNFSGCFFGMIKTNKELRDILYNIDNQDAKLNFYTRSNKVFIYL